MTPWRGFWREEWHKLIHALNKSFLLLGELLTRLVGGKWEARKPVRKQLQKTRREVHGLDQVAAVKMVSNGQILGIFIGKRRYDLFTENQGFQNDFNVLGLNNGRDGVSINQDGKDRLESVVDWIVSPLNSCGEVLVPVLTSLPNRIHSRFNWLRWSQAGVGWAPDPIWQVSF